MELRLLGRRPRGVEAALARRLAEDGWRVGMVPGAGGWAATTRLALALERWAGDAGSLHRSLDQDPWPALPSPALVLDFSRTEAAGDLCLQLRVWHRFGWQALADAAASGRAVPIAIVQRDSALVTGLCAVDDPTRLGTALDGLLARVIDLAVVAAARAVGGDVKRHDTPAPAVTAPRAGAFAPLARRLGRLIRGGYRPDVWEVLWTTGDDPFLALAETSGWRAIPNPPGGWLADPFPFVDASGALHLFVEHWDDRRGRGVIAHLQRMGDGWSAPRTVLDSGRHLSFPAVFAAEGQVWMLPEGEAAGAVTIYRADPFPDRWQPHAQLLARPLADPLLVHEGGAWWLWGTDARDPGSRRDALLLFRGDRLEGPYRPVGPQPVRVDAGAARAAGWPWRDGAGRRWRPVQDGRLAYGDRLALVPMPSMDAELWRAAVPTPLPRPPGWLGVHSLAMAAGLVFTDRKREGPAAPLSPWRARCRNRPRS